MKRSYIIIVFSLILLTLITAFSSFVTAAPNEGVIGIGIRDYINPTQMSTTMLIIYAFLAFVIMLVAAELLGKKAENVGSRVSASVGILIVAITGSIPELAVSLNAVWAGSPSLAVGSIIGSNIANVALVLGISSFIRPVKVEKGVLKTLLPFVIILLGVFTMFYSLTFYPRPDLSLSEPTQRIMTGYEGIFLIVCFFIYLMVMAVIRRGEEMESGEGSVLTSLIIVILAGVVVWYSAEISVICMIELATRYGISAIIIGATIVAVGTSLPELAVSIMASIKGKAEIAFGNVVESNAFDMAVCLGLPAAFAVLYIAPELAYFHIPFMIITNIIVLALVMKGELGRRSGLILLLIYAAYIVIMFTGGHAMATNALTPIFG